MKTAPSQPERDQDRLPPSPSMLAALTQLRTARDAAADLRLDVWEFAVGLAELLAAGVTGTDLRRLVAAGLVERGDECRRPRDGRRAFRRTADLALTDRACFVLTPAGERLLEMAILRPVWDPDRRQLWYDNRLVKWFRAEACNQEVVLAAFQEDGWPPRIDDPLPRVPGTDPQERLLYAVRRLNSNQITRLLVFRRDGTGEGVLWAPWNQTGDPDGAPCAAAVVSHCGE